MKNRQKLKVCFSLIELLIVIAIIAILSSLLLPSLRSAKMKGKRLQCASRQKQIISASYMYVNDYSEYFPASSPAARWRIKILPYISNSWADNWNETDGWQKLSSLESVYRCPVTPQKIIDLSKFITGIGINFIVSGSDPLPNKISRVRYPSETIFCGDTNDNPAAAHYPVHLYKSNDYRNAPEGFRHTGGINVGFCDGHATWEKRLYLINNSTLYDLAK